MISLTERLRVTLGRVDQPPLLRAGRDTGHGSTGVGVGERYATTTPWLVTSIISPAATRRSTSAELLRSSRCVMESIMQASRGAWHARSVFCGLLAELGA